MKTNNQYALSTMHRIKACLALSACVLSTSLFAPVALANKANNTLGMAYDQAPENIDPYYNNVRIGVIIANNVWDTLVYRDPITNAYS